jgi:exosome complex component RRP42
MPPPITTIPISVTAVRIGDSVLLDPTMEEEACMDARLTITTQSDGDLVALQKGYTGPFAITEILRSVEIARIKGEEIRSKIKGLNETG